METGSGNLSRVAFMGGCGGIEGNAEKQDLGKG